MIQEFERVILTTDLPSHNLQKGDIGTVVMVYKNGKAFEVEFITLNGLTILVTTLNAEQVRPIGNFEIAHARELAEFVSD